MKFDEFDAEMRQYELSLDQYIADDDYIVVRLDGRTFTKLTREICKFEAPFDIKFRDMMVETVKSLMSCGFRIVYGYSESDEISLLFHKDDHSFGRKVRKLTSVLAGQASAVFSMQLGRIAVFDARVIPLPSIELVKDYFIWRQEDAKRNALNAYCYWILRKDGYSAGKAGDMVKGKSLEEKLELLGSYGIDFEAVPSWQKHGFGVTFKNVVKEGYNPVTDSTTETIRRVLDVDFDLKTKNEYGNYLSNLIG